MQLHEANARLDKEITLEELQDIEILYHLMNIDKDDFCAIVNLIGMEKLTAQKARYLELRTGWQEGKAHGSSDSSGQQPMLPVNFLYYERCYQP